MVYKITSIKSGRRAHRCFGGTLAEMVVSVGVGVLVLAALASFAFFNSRSMASVYNYIDMDQDSQKAIDQMSKDFRGAYSVSSFKDDQVTIRDATNGPLTYTYSGSKDTLTRTYRGTTRVMLKECTKLEFGMEQRNVEKGSFNYYSTEDVAECKAVTIEFVCSRSLLGRRSWMETHHAVRFVIRN